MAIPFDPADGSGAVSMGFRSIHGIATPVCGLARNDRSGAMRPKTPLGHQGEPFAPVAQPGRGGACPSRVLSLCTAASLGQMTGIIGKKRCIRRETLREGQPPPLQD